MKRHTIHPRNYAFGLEFIFSHYLYRVTSAVLNYGNKLQEGRVDLKKSLWCISGKQKNSETMEEIKKIIHGLKLLVIAITCFAIALCTSEIYSCVTKC